MTPSMARMRMPEAKRLCICRRERGISNLCACCSGAVRMFVWNNEGRSLFQEASARGWDEVMQLPWEHGGHEYAAECDNGLAL
jgi:hypothetical protein